MAFTSEEQAEYSTLVGAYIESKRPPVALRKKVDLSFKISGQSVELFQGQVGMDGRWVDVPAAKATYVKTQDHWRLFWMRSDHAWHAYEPVKTVKRLSRFLKIVEEDSYGCFWG